MMSESITANKKGNNSVHRENMLYISWLGMNSGYKPLMTEGQLCLTASSSNWNNKKFLVYHNIWVYACIPILVNFNERKNYVVNICFP